MVLIVHSEWRCGTTVTVVSGWQWAWVPSGHLGFLPQETERGSGPAAALACGMLTTAAGNSTVLPAHIPVFLLSQPPLWGELPAFLATDPIIGCSRALGWFLAPPEMIPSGVRTLPSTFPRDLQG